MPTAIWKKAILAESKKIAHVEGNAYFPIKNVNSRLVRTNPSLQKTFCHWKGFASYFDVIVGKDINIGAAWEYKKPYKEACIIKNHIAFWNGVEIIDAPSGRGLVEGTPSKKFCKRGWESLCWLIRHSENDTLDHNDLLEHTGLTNDQFDEAWNIPDVARYAKRYRWRIQSRTPLLLKRSKGKPINLR